MGTDPTGTDPSAPDPSHAVPTHAVPTHAVPTHPGPGVSHDPDEANTNELDPLVPRPIDRPTVLPLSGRLDPDVGDIAKVFAAPADPADWPVWREALRGWRDESRRRLGYSGAGYERADAGWTTACYSVALVWLWDERLFDHDRQEFTVDAFLAATADHGGFDAVVLWHAYPMIGIDERNQFDFYRDVPGLTDLVARLHERGLRVFLDYNPWDTGTRRTGRGDPEELAALVGELGVDGVFLDTMKEGDRRLIDALAAADPSPVLEGESRVPNQRIEDHHFSWAQWFADSEAPGVLRAHWYERRHMLHQTRRWNRDHSDELQSSWMNGTGILVWDAVFGVWVGWNARDRSSLRRMLRVQRALGDLFVSGEWTPLTDASSEALAARVYVSRFDCSGLSLWTLINRADQDFVGRPIDDGIFDAGIFKDGLSQDSAALGGATAPGTEDVHIFDVTSGQEISDGTVRVPARGVAGVLRVTGPIPAAVAELLDAARQDSPSADARFPAREAIRVPAPRSTARPVAQSPAGLPGDAILVEAGRRRLDLAYRRRETGMYQGAPYVEEWKPLPPRLHDDRVERIDVELRRVAVARSEVSRAQFAGFLEATGYRPAIPNRFLADWSGTTPLPGTEDEPVTLVNLADARAYAVWAGARLPTEFEWQVAATDPRFTRRAPLVWNWTESEHTDGVTRFVMLKGGSAHVSPGSDWYFDGGPRPPEFSAKLLVPGLGLDRSESIGFRLAWDRETAA